MIWFLGRQCRSICLSSNSAPMAAMMRQQQQAAFSGRNVSAPGPSRVRPMSRRVVVTVRAFNPASVPLERRWPNPEFIKEVCSLQLLFLTFDPKTSGHLRTHRVYAVFHLNPKSHPLRFSCCSLHTPLHLSHCRSLLPSLTRPSLPLTRHG